MKPKEVIGLMKEQELKFVDFRFTDTKGKEHHVTVPAHTVDEDLFEDGKMSVVDMENSSIRICCKEGLQMNSCSRRCNRCSPCHP